MIKDILNYCNKKINEGHKVKVHISRLDTNEVYDALMGIYVDGKLNRTIEIENTTNVELDKIQNCIQEDINKKTLYLI